MLASDRWHRGVVGIAAARVVETLGVPAVVVAFDGDVGHGSARTTEGFDIYDALGRCAADLSAWGGHRAAAGLSLELSALERFRSSFASAAPPERFQDSGATEIDVALGGPFRVPTLSDLRRLGPFGEGHPSPLFAVDAHVVEANGVGEGQVHAKLELQVGQERVRAFAPDMFERLAGRPNVRLMGEFQPDHWVGGQSVELLVRDLLD